MSATLWQRFGALAETRGEAIAIRHGARAISFAGLAAQALAWARALPVAAGERVVIAGRNGIDIAAAVPGIWARGAIPVFVHADAPDSHLAHALRQTGAMALLTDPGPALPFDGPMIHLPIVPDLPPALPPDLPPLPDQDATAPGSIVFTSGSTGLPKGVVQAAGTLAGGVDRVAAALGYRADDSILCPIPFAFDYGWGQLLSLLLGGYPLILPEPRSAAGLCAAIAVHRPSILAGVPAVFAELLAGLAPIRDIDRSSVRLITNTGSRIPDPVREGLVALFPDAALSLNYGLTETYRSATLPPEQAVRHPASVGFALPGAALTVLCPDGREAAPGEEGEIVHRGAGVFLGYWGDPERTAEVLRPDPCDPAARAVFTGDLGHKDAEGRLYLHGRRDRQMKSMGVRVSPDEIEGLLLASGLLREAAVVARAHDMLGDLIVAVVCLAETEKARGEEEVPALTALKRHARAVMSPHMQPRDWVVLAGLPRNPSGKVDYPALTRAVAGQEGQEGGHG